MPENPTGRPMIVQYETASGVMIHVTPLSPFTLAAIHARAEEEFPYPDPKPYETEIENAADPSIKLPAADNPEYKALCAPINQERIAWRLNAYIEVACEYPEFETRDAMIAHFRPRLEALRKVATLFDDDWENVLKHCVFTGNDDRNNIISIANQNGTISLTPAEGVEGIRFFRMALQG